MQTGNPALPADTFTKQPEVRSLDQMMTVQGVVIKTALSLVLVILSAAWVWNIYLKSASNPAAVNPWILGGAIGGFIIALITAFKQSWAPITTPLYAVLEGFFIGGMSAILEQAMPGIVIQASLLTFGTLGAMLVVYETGLIKVNDTFKMVIFSATGGIALTYLITIVLGFFNIQVPFIYGNGIGGILFSLFVIAIAALNFVIDFDFISKGTKSGAPKYMEWYGAFALLVTLIWLYIEFLRLLSKLRSR